jgi:hypothetical protein
MTATGAAGFIVATLAPVGGNQMVASGVMNTIVIPRDGWYKFSLDAQYQNSAGSAFYSYVQQNGTNIIIVSGNQNAVASAPTAAYSRVAWCKAGDRIVVQSSHNEGGATVRQINGVLTIEEIVS